MNFLSPDSKCYSFDLRANGYARGEGSAVMVIKLLDQAIKDGDLIRAVIRATGANQDGRTPGITHPNSEAQQEMIRCTYDSAGIDPHDTHFFEAHGTGTTAGDLAEATAITNVFKASRDPNIPLRIGAVKSNIGHLEGVAGLAGLIKTVLVLEKGIIPSNIWFERPNGLIDPEAWNIKVWIFSSLKRLANITQFPVKSEPWPTAGLRRASINSFGYGGANAHVILEDAFHFLKSRKLGGKHRTVATPMASHTPNTSSSFKGLTLAIDVTDLEPKGGPKVFIRSSSDESGIARVLEACTGFLEKSQAISAQCLDDLAYTLSERRSCLSWQTFAVADSVTELLEKTKSGISKPVRPYKGRQNIFFIFTGQGANWAQMGRELFSMPAFRESIQRTQAYVRQLGCELNIRGTAGPWIEDQRIWILIHLVDEVIRPDPGSSLKTAACSQLVCTALQVALVDVLAECNVYPARVTGHSSGEIAAAYCAVAITQQSACKLAYYRGTVAARLITDSAKSSGSVMAVALSESDATTYLFEHQSRPLSGHISIGCVNSPTNVTLTGDAKTMESLKTKLDADQIHARVLSVDVAYHSAHMDQVAADYLGLIQRLEQPDQTKLDHKPLMYSSVTGSMISADKLALGEYWVQNLVSKVKFADAIKTQHFDHTRKSSQNQEETKESTSMYFLEVGPHPVLRNHQSRGPCL